MLMLNNVYFFNAVLDDKIAAVVYYFNSFDRKTSMKEVSNRLLVKTESALHHRCLFTRLRHDLQYSFIKELHPPDVRQTLATLLQRQIETKC